MKAEFIHKNKIYNADLTKPIDISIPLKNENSVLSWHLNNLKIEPVKAGNFIGDTNMGGSVNFKNIKFNPHAHGTHTECVGHISKDFFSINKILTKFLFFAKLITIKPKEKNNDKIITLSQVKSFLKLKEEALIIRTLPNNENKLIKNYSGTNPTYITEKLANYIKKENIKHLLIDTPSVDKEIDGGKLLAHKAFWNYPKKPNKNTITELIFVPNYITDGNYLLNLQIASFENDASPSKPILYPLILE